MVKQLFYMARIHFHGCRDLVGAFFLNCRAVEKYNIS
jgi:hypothetical protein